MDRPDAGAPADAREPARARPRDARLDVLKGVLIIAVVVGHFVEASGRGALDIRSGWDVEPQRLVLHVLYLFHMPLFVFLAGVTASRRRLGTRIAQMAGLYLVLQMTYSFLWAEQVTLLTPVVPVFALWFLVALVWWLASLPLVHRLGALALPTSLLAALAVVAVPLEDTTAWFSWARAVTFWPFFVAGHLYGWPVLRWFSARGRRLVPLAVLVLVVVDATVLLSDFDQRWYRGTETAVSTGETIASGALLRAVVIAAAVACSFAVMALVPRRSSLLEALGQRSLAIYALHPPFVILARIWFNAIEIGAWASFAAGLAMSFVCVAVLSLPPVDRALRRLVTVLGDVLTLRPLRA